MKPFFYRPLLLAWCIGICGFANFSVAETNAPAPITFMKSGGWCWFQDPRGVIHNGQLVVGGLDGQNGDVKVAVYDLKAGTNLGTVTLHAQFERDDHDVPGLYVRPDGSVLAVYAKHAKERIHYYRISNPTNYLQWGPERRFVHDYPESSTVTYMNLHAIKSEGKLYNFFRGIGYNPSFITSTNHGLTWGEPTHFIADEVDGRQRPYPRYVQRDADTVGISFTEAHPRDFGNSIYYAEFRGGAFYRADGRKIKDLTAGPLRPSEAEKIFSGSGIKTNRNHSLSNPRSAWTAGIAVDAAGRPHLGYSFYLSNDDHRFRIAAWDGRKWLDREVAYAGKCLYERESSYTGLITFDPTDPTRVWISTDVDPRTGKDSGGKHEIYTARITAADEVRSIRWEPVTSGSPERNIRPILVAGEGYKVLLWLRGPWRTFVDYDSDIVGVVLQRP
jgi:hypothetical protein